MISLPEPEKYQDTDRNERAQNDAVSSLLAAYPLHQAVDAGYLCCGACDPSLYACQILPLYAETLIDSICLAQHIVCHIMTVVDSPPLVQHVLCFGAIRVLASPV